MAGRSLAPNQPRPGGWSRRLRWGAALVGLCAVASIPAGVRDCRERGRAREAPQLLSYLADRAIAHYRTHRAWPPPTPLTPAANACCAAGGSCAPDANRWTADGWRALAFTIDDPHRYSYALEVVRADAGGPDGLRVRAVGDVNCDGQVDEQTWTLTPADDRIDIVRAHSP